MNDLEILHRLAVALSVGLVIGFERGWHERDAPEGARIAGIRTFALVGVAGGLVAVLAAETSALVPASITLGLAGVLVIARLMSTSEKDVGATTEVAIVVTFSLGVLAGVGHLAPAAAGAVVSALLLGLKPVLHRWLRGIDERELFAALQLLVISVVVLPILPDAGFGPFGALNPYRLWWMVVLVASVSFAGYVLVKLLGARAGLLLTGLCGGLVSSTAITLALVRRSRELDPSFHGTVAAGIAAAATTMLARIAVLVIIVYPPLFADLAVPFGAAVAMGVGTVVWLWRTGSAPLVVEHGLAPQNPLDLRVALVFGFLLAVVMLLAETSRVVFGPTGLYVLSAIAALADTDAIALSLADQAQRQLARDVAVTGVAIAVAVNSGVKVALAAGFGPWPLARRVTVALTALLLAGAIGLAGQRLMLN